jgi:hypothetical protein
MDASRIGLFAGLFFSRSTAVFVDEYDAGQLKCRSSTAIA